MKKNSGLNPLTGAIIFGLVAGMRTMAAPAIVTHLLSRHPSAKLKNSPLNFMQSPVTSNVFKVLAAGELIGDKLPNAPNRIEAPGLIGRCIAAGLAGASIYKAAGKPFIEGALLGGITAFCATYGAFYLRTRIGKGLNIYDPYLGLAEDTLVIGTACALTI